MRTNTLEVAHLGTVEYEDGLDLQEALRAAVAAGTIPDQLVLLEHPHVVTLGRNAGEDNLLLSPEELRARGIAFHRTGRGGDVTYHGPGQIVGYPVIDLAPERRGARRYVNDLEEAIIRTLADWGVTAGRTPGLTGVWVGERKIAAIGVRISRRITTHGFAFNVCTDLERYGVMVPCGITDRGVTSLSEELGREIAPADVREGLAGRLAEQFGRRLVHRELASHSVQVLVWRRAASGPEVLVLERLPECGGFWQPVTGLLENDERPRDAAVREVVEEVGLRGDLTDLGIRRDFHIDRRYVGGDDPHPWLNREHAFALRVEDARVDLSPEEHRQYEWVAPEVARERFVWSGNRLALTLLERWWAA